MKATDRLAAQLGSNIAESMGRGIGLPPAVPPPPVLRGEAAKHQGVSRVRDALAIPVDRLIPDPNQPRREFDPGSLADLAASLQSRGQLQPIRVRWDDASARWVIISGERRYRAAVMAGLPTLICVEATKALTEDDILEDQLVENCLRDDLRPIEQARSFRALMDRKRWTTRQLGESIHVSSGHITRVLALLDLPDDLQARVTSGELAPSVAYEVSRLETPDQQREVASRVVDEGLSRTEAVEAIRAAKGTVTSAKGRGVGKACKPTSRVFKVAGGKVAVELRKGSGTEAIRAALAEALGRLDAELGADGQAAA